MRVTLHLQASASVLDLHINTYLHLRAFCKCRMQIYSKPVAVGVRCLAQGQLDTLGSYEERGIELATFWLPVNPLYLQS